MRRDDWRERLRACFADAARRRFRYGRHECAGFAARCVTAVLTEPPVIPKWHDARSAGALIGAGDLFDQVKATAERNGWPEIGPRFAMTGDLVYRADQSRFRGAVGIVDFTGRRALFASDQGLAPIAITEFGAAWRI